MTQSTVIEETLSTLASNFSHDMRTSLSAIKMGINSIQTYLPLLIETYHTAKKHQLSVADIPNHLLNLLEELIKANTLELDYAGLQLALFSENLKHNASSDKLESISIKTALTTAFSRYPYRSDLEKRFSKPNMAFDDFVIDAIPNKLMLVFSGLIRNILSRATNETYSIVDISHMRDNASETLIIEDAGELFPANPNQVFERLYLTKNKHP